MQCDGLPEGLEVEPAGEELNRQACQYGEDVGRTEAFAGEPIEEAERGDQSPGGEELEADERPGTFGERLHFPVVAFAQPDGDARVEPAAEAGVGEDEGGETG